MVLRLVLLLLTLSLVSCYKLENFERGGGKAFQSSQDSSSGEKGEKGYTGHHQIEQGARGQHDKENHQKEYAEKSGKKQGYSHQDGYYSQQHQGEKGQNGYHFDENGRYAKGHSTKGHHNIHKLDEYKKNTDFYDEDNDEGFEERHGGYEVKKAQSNGKLNAAGYKKKIYIDENYGKAGLATKGSHYFDDKGFKKVFGHDGYFGHYADFVKKGGQNQFKDFGYSGVKQH